VAFWKSPRLFPLQNVQLSTIFPCTCLSLLCTRHGFSDFAGRPGLRISLRTRRAMETALLLPLQVVQQSTNPRAKASRVWPPGREHPEIKGRSPPFSPGGRGGVNSQKSKVKTFCFPNTPRGLRRGQFQEIEGKHLLFSKHSWGLRRGQTPKIEGKILLFSKHS
jgi:hypothetical protein